MPARSADGFSSAAAAGEMDFWASAVNFFATHSLCGCVIGSKFFVCDEEAENWRNGNLCQVNLTRVENFHGTQTKMGLRQLDERASQNDNLSCHHSKCKQSL